MSQSDASRIFLKLVTRVRPRGRLSPAVRGVVAPHLCDGAHVAGEPRDGASVPVCRHDIPLQTSVGASRSRSRGHAALLGGSSSSNRKDDRMSSNERLRCNQVGRTSGPRGTISMRDASAALPTSACLVAAPTPALRSIRTGQTASLAPISPRSTQSTHHPGCALRPIGGPWAALGPARVLVCIRASSLQPRGCSAGHDLSPGSVRAVSPPPPSHVGDASALRRRHHFASTLQASQNLRFQWLEAGSTFVQPR
jgi:hypothetical protein